MKKILATILAVAMLATTFVGCGGGGDTASTPSDDGGAECDPGNLPHGKYRQRKPEPFSGCILES